MAARFRYDATSDYHLFQLRATRRFNQGLSVDGNYTFSKNLDTASRESDSFQIPWQFPELERALSSLDRTHVFTGRCFISRGNRRESFHHGEHREHGEDADGLQTPVAIALIFIFAFVCIHFVNAA